MAHKDVETLVRKLKKLEGVAVIRNGEGHYTVRKGDAVISLSQTPSDARWKANALADLKRAGIDLTARRTPSEQAHEREVFILDHLMARKHTTAELTRLLNEAGEEIGESGVRARLQRMEAKGWIFRANGATQGTEVQWRARSAVPDMPKSVAPQPEPQVNGHISNAPANGHGRTEVTSTFDLAKATATLTIVVEGPLEEILGRLVPLVHPTS